MTIQQLHVFLTVAEELNITKAAKKLFMSRQGVKQHISALENELQLPLFSNEKNRLSLTDFGSILYHRGLPVVREFELLQNDMRSLVHDETPIRLGISSSVIPFFLPGLNGVLKSFRETFTKLILEEVLLPNDELSALVSSGTLDAAVLLDFGLCAERLHRIPLTTQPTGVMVTKTDPLYSKEQLTVRDLDQHTILFPGTGPEFAPVLSRIAGEGITITPKIIDQFYKMYYQLLENGLMALDRYSPEDSEFMQMTRTIPVSGLPQICSSFLMRENETRSSILLLANHLEKCSSENRLLSERKPVN